MATISEAFAIALEHHQGGRLQAAEQIYRQILAVDPDHIDALHLSGIAAHQNGQREEAVKLIQRAIRLNGKEAVFHNSLGNVLTAPQKWDEAIAAYHRAIQLKSDYAEAHYNLGIALSEKEMLNEAVVCYRRALELRPGYAEAHYNLGKVTFDQEKLDDAIASYRRALELKPQFADGHNNLGIALRAQGKLEEAVTCYRRALELKPDYAEAHNNLGNAKKDQWKLDEAVACYHRALELRPDYCEAHSSLLMIPQYCTGVTLKGLLEAHAEYDRQHAAPLRGTNSRHTIPHNPRGGVRLGFVSPDFGRHPVGYFLIRVLENLRHDQPCETYCYSDRMIKDEMTFRLQAAALQWRDVAGVSDERLAEQIREDQIDILFDLAGHTAHNRLLVFARKPAPVQITWMGYMCTTGLSAMDYLLADRYEVPASAEPYYRERILRMPDGHICYAPPSYAPEVSSLPAWEQGHVTLGCFNNPTKITLQIIAVWAKILRRLPDARLVLKAKGLEDPPLTSRFMEAFAAGGVDARRLEFLGASPHAALLGEYRRIDIALDTAPYTGCLTTCEALWMGVPVITSPGETMTSRQSYSCIANAGLTGTIARDLDEYVELAVSLASDLPRLAGLRATLRTQMAASPLCDGQRFATHFLDILQDVWEQRRSNGNDS